MKKDAPPPVPVANPRPSGIGILAVLLLWPVIGAVAGWMVAALLTYVAPKKYESRVILQVNPAVQQVDPFGGKMGEAVTGAYMTPQFFATEFQVITAEQTLRRVIDRLDLATRWDQAPDVIVGMLKAMIETEQLRGTDLIEIRVRHPSAQDARDIADTIALSYKERRTQLEAERAMRALDALDGELRDQEDLVEEKRKVLHTIVQAVGIPYIEGAPGSGGQKNDEELYREAERALFDLEQERAQLEVQVKTMLKLKDEELRRYAAALDLEGNAIKDLERELRVEQRVLEGLRRGGLGDGNPQIVQQKARIEVLEEDIAQGIGTLREILQTKMNLVDSRVEAMREVVKRKRHAAVDRALESTDYVEAKREYEQAQEMLQAMKLQHSSKRIALQIPKNPITIHEAARIGRRPVSPRVSTNLLLGSVMGLLAGVLIAIPIALAKGMRR